ncbi:ATP phosphoribosyltransferase regulatory subunit [methanotrophic endosymbiont of Bathymodiolus puteoserpentis (Logatchev)]|jgi:ATP phosphoribosyltransferase regulatory subunit|uniref:ATP phosphoribosyltransferase regulatory subunit n=1 Tax=methanotrophic endosymbiont of Bathymodiolus puteoserpentis (Logatchev) TaxID=343235 RepID=UPI0013CA262F|nr:ATP phosphoribosyltransferase regulatory subunit [methanotrophic endosymbiont of Bathymodiolus puteoserpentis (Logatchev)]SHE22819.1 ATP phosphoribosyltransferase regulatory subunit [methanotrophic endosymbiont of Bathymodiolus puteoserpentis (Logatchev)]
MLQRDPWLLPEGVEEVLPEDARHLEVLRRQLLDVFECWGYEKVIPPFIDYLDSLLTGSAHDLNLQTFKLTDQLSGEVLGIRADMTPQVARIDAHSLSHQQPSRLCYVGTTLHTRGGALDKTRIPMQIGAELFGHAGIDSDAEIVQLMLEVLAVAGVKNVHLDLGHVAIYRGLVAQAKLTEEQELELFDILQRKSNSELSSWLDRYAIPEELQAIFLSLPKLNGDQSILATAQTVFTSADVTVKAALAELIKLADLMHAYYPELTISFDLAELRGYYYHTGVVFSAFVPEMGKEIARGGRYDNIGQIFGRARPATGFSADLKILAALTKVDKSTEDIVKILAPMAQGDLALDEKVRDLRAKGRIVIKALSGQQVSAQELGCKQILEKNDGNWVLVTLN